MPCEHLILCHPLLLLPSIFPSIRVFSNELGLHIMLTKCWSFTFSISPSFLVCGYPVFPAPFIKETTLSSICSLSILVIYKTIQPYISGLTSGLSSASLVYMSIFKPVTYCFGYHSFVICFTIRKCVRPRAFFFCLKIFWLLKVL